MLLRDIHTLTHTDTYTHRCAQRNWLRFHPPFFPLPLRQVVGKAHKEDEDERRVQDGGVGGGVGVAWWGSGG